MRHPIQNIALLLIALLIATTLFNLVRYFTSARYTDRRTRRLQIFVLISSIHLIIACLLLANDIVAWYKDYFYMLIWPTEHSFSFQKVGANLAIAIGAYIIAWLMMIGRIEERWLPGEAIIGVFTCLAVAASLLLIYFSWGGYCCESEMTLFAGFPFSYLRGSYRLQDNRYQELFHFSLMGILAQHNSSFDWHADVRHLLLNILFWGNSFTILFVIFRSLLKKKELSTIK